MITIANLVSLLTARGLERVYKLNAVPKEPQYPYVVVGIGSPDKVARSTDGQAADLHRVTAQFFSRTVEGLLDYATRGDLDGEFLDGRLIEREVSTSPYRDPDDGGVLVILHTYRL